MQIQTADTLVGLLQSSGLYSADEMTALAAELAAVGSDPQVLMRHLLHTGRITHYQLRKVVHGKAAELVVGPYVVLDKLGEGGMGRVFRARQTRTGRIVALKVVRPSLLTNPIVRGRYEREVLATSSLSHPNIVSVFDAGSADGRYYLEMEFVDGVDLARLVRTHGILPVPEACEYLRQTALGLHHAHERGFVHRDIKPSNIVVSGERHLPSATEPARVKLLDMGLVRSVGFDDGGGPDLTRDGTVVGTPDYMAPEQAKNSSAVDHRADLYSLGGTFYYLLTGQPPFPSGSAIEKILKHQVDPPPPLQAARPDVPGELAQIVARLLAKKPSDRFATAGELAAALTPLTQFSPGAEEVRARPAQYAEGPAADAVPPLTAAFPSTTETLPPSSVTFLPSPPSNTPAASPSRSEKHPFLFSSLEDRGSPHKNNDRSPMKAVRVRPNRRPTAASRQPASATVVLVGLLGTLLAIGILVAVVVVAYGAWNR